jgi:hypothetical protein
MDENPTKPTIETVLERIESLRTETRDQIESLRKEVLAEMAANHRAVRRSLDHLAGEIVQIKVVQDYIEEQLKK